MENNFKTIKDSVTRIIFESHNTQNSDMTLVWKGFVNELKASPILKTLYIVYTNIENNKFADKDTAEIFLNENLFSFGSFSKAQILNESTRIKSLIKEHVTEFKEDILFELILESAKDRKLSDLSKKAELFRQVVNSLIKEADIVKEEVKSVSPAVIKRAMQILNEKYSFLNEGERGILNAFLCKDEEKKKNLYESLVNENIKMIKRKLIENQTDDEELTELLTLTEEKLKTLEYNSDTPISAFSDLINFQKD